MKKMKLKTQYHLQFLQGNEILRYSCIKTCIESVC